MSRIIRPTSPAIISRRNFLVGVGASAALHSNIARAAPTPIQRLNRGRVKPYNSVPRIDWSHPLAQGLLTCCYDAGGQIIDLVSGQMLTALQVNGAQMSKIGMGLKFPNPGAVGANTSGYGYMPPLLAGRTSNSFGAVAPYSAIVSTFFTGPVGPGNPDADCALVVIQDAGNTTNTVFGFNSWPAAGSGNPTGGDTVSAIVNNKTNAFGTHTVVQNTYQSWGWGAVDGNNGLFYSNGVFDQGFGGTNTFTGIPNGQIMYATASINTGQTFGNGINGFVPKFMFWNRLLSPIEFKMEYDNPFGMFIYPEDEMLDTLVGVAGVLPPQVGRWHSF